MKKENSNVSMKVLLWSSLGGILLPSYAIYEVMKVEELSVTQAMMFIWKNTHNPLLFIILTASIIGLGLWVYFKTSK